MVLVPTEVPGWTRGYTVHRHHHGMKEKFVHTWQHSLVTVWGRPWDPMPGWHSWKLWTKSATPAREDILKACMIRKDENTKKYFMANLWQKFAHILIAFGGPDVDRLCNLEGKLRSWKHEWKSRKEKTENHWFGMWTTQRSWKTAMFFLPSFFLHGVRYK